MYVFNCVLCYIKSWGRAFRINSSLTGSKEAINWRKILSTRMKGKLVLAIAILGALFSLGYCAGCDYKNVAYQSNTGRTWTINVYVKQCKYILYQLLIVILSSVICFITVATGRACIEDPHVAESCSRYGGGCSSPFHGISVCYDDKYSKWPSKYSHYVNLATY